jgi:hypothetical protein
MSVDAKTDQMISLVLQINGFVKAEDLHSLPPDQRALALRSYYESHASSDALHWRGEQLWTGAQAPPDQSFFAETPAATVPAPAVAAVDPASFGGGAMPVAPEMNPYPTTAPAVPVAVAGEVDAFGDLVRSEQPAPAVAAVAEVPSVELAPLAADPGAYASPEAMPVAVAPAAAAPAAAEPFVVEPPVYAPPVDSRLEPDFLPDPVAAQAFSLPDDQPVSPLWWILAILWAPLGGIVAWAVLKGDNPRGAKKMLTISLIVWGASIALGFVFGALSVLLGG